jgi:Ca2+-binding EF-hand superfamily protein
LDIDEFTTLYEEEMHIVEILVKAETMFRLLDKDASGYLEKSEFSKIVDFMLKTDLGTKEAKKLTKEKCVEMIEAKDGNADGKLSLDEFTLLYEEVLNLVPRDAEGEAHVLPDDV